MLSARKSLLLLPLLLLLAQQWLGSLALFAAAQSPAPAKPAYTARIAQDQQFTANAPSRARVQVVDGAGQAVPWSKLSVTAERKLHFVAVHENLGALLHIHPEDFGQVDPTADSFVIEPVFPFAGKYGIGLDFLPSGGGDEHAGHGKSEAPTEVLSSVTVQGEKPAQGGPSFPRAGTSITVTSLPIGDSERLTMPIVYSSMLAPSTPNPGVGPTYLINATTLAATKGTVGVGECVYLQFAFFAVNGATVTPATKLEKYLGADSHITVVKDDLSLINHLHGFKATAGMKPMACGEHESKEAAPSDASLIALPLRLAVAGKYRIFLQTKVDGRMVAPSFALTVGNASAAAAPSNPAPAAPAAPTSHVGHAGGSGSGKLELGAATIAATLAAAWFVL